MSGLDSCLGSDSRNLDLLLSFCWREDLMNKCVKPEDYCLNSHLLFANFSYGVTWLHLCIHTKYDFLLLLNTEELLPVTSVDPSYHLMSLF